MRTLACLLWWLLLLWAVLLFSFSLAQAQNPKVTLTGIIQGPNGLPAANSIISLSPTQTFFIAGLGSASCNSYVLEVNAVILTCADTVNFNNSTPAPPANGINVTWATSNALGIDSVSAAVVGDGNATHCLLGTGAFGACGAGAISGLTPGVVPQAGSSTGIVNSSPQLDNGVTTAGTLTYAGPIAAASNGVNAGVVRIIGNITVPAALPATGFWGWLGFNSASAGSFFFQPNTNLASATNGQALTVGSPGTCTGSSATCIPLNATTLLSQGNGGLPSSPQTGDTIEYNRYGDNQWHSAMPPTRFEQIYVASQLNSYEVLGTTYTGAATPITLGTWGIVNPTAVDAIGGTLSAAATASTNTVLTMVYPEQTNFGLDALGNLYRWSARFMPGNTTNVRYWMGITKYDAGGSGCETARVEGTTCFAANAPARSIIGFRYSAGTDTHWQAVASLVGGTQTLVDTGKTPDTANPHNFEFAYNGGTSVVFFYDGAVVATITTNVPPSTLFRTMQFWCGDNQNTNTAISGTMYSMNQTFK